MPERRYSVRVAAAAMLLGALSVLGLSCTCADSRATTHRAEGGPRVRTWAMPIQRPGLPNLHKVWSNLIDYVRNLDVDKLKRRAANVSNNPRYSTHQGAR